MNSSESTERRTGSAFILIFVCLAAGIVAAGGFYYRHYAKQYRAEAERHLSAIADLKVSELVQWRKERLDDATILFKNDVISALVRRFLANPADADAQRQLLTWLGKFQEHRDFDVVRLLDAQGVSRLSVPAELPPVSSVVGRRIPEILRAGQVVFQDFHRNEYDQRIYLDALVPIFDESDASRPLGLFYLRINPARYLYPSIQRWPTPSQTAETLLVRREGNEAVFLNELRFQTNTALNFRLPLDRVSVPAVQAALGHEGIMAGTDYRGVPVLAASRTVPGSPWALVTKMDALEIDAPLRERLWTTIFLMAALLLGTGAGTVMLWRQERVRFYRERAEAAEILRESEARYRLLFNSSNDAIFVHTALTEDPQSGKFIAVNDVACQRLGYTRDELLQMGVRDIDAPLTQDAVRAIVEKFKAGNHALWEGIHVAKDGRKIPVEINAHHFTLDGKTVALSSVRDITERKQAERQVVDAMNYAQTLLAASPIGVITYKASGQVVSANEAAAKLVGTSVENLKRQNFRELDSWKKSGFLKMADLSLATGQVQSFEDHVVSSYGVAAWLLCRFVPFSFEGEPHLLLLATDISERKRAEHEIRRQAAFAQFNPNPVLELSATGEVLYANAAALRMANALGEKEHATQILPPNTAAIVRDCLATNRSNLRLETSVKNRTISWSFFPVTQNQVVHCYAGDITERKLAEAAQARLATAVEQAAESIVITDTSGVILYANPAFEKTSGYTCVEALGQNPRILKSGKHEPEFYRQMWEAIAGGEIWRSHFINRRKDGTLFEEEATITPVRDATGKVINYVAVKRDVTHEMQLEAQFRQSQKMEAIGQLAGGVAHDFNNILAVIQLQAGLLKAEQGLSGRQLEYAGDIEKATQRAANLTRQLLLFSRKQALQLRDLDLNEVVISITKMLQRILGEQIQMQFKFAPQPLLIHADTGMMDQVLMNLTVNARDAMPQGGQLIVETSAVEFDEGTAAQSAQARPGAFACVSVTDTGCGIPPEILSRIFEPFFTTKEVGKGTGLGLATVFGIVQQHRGWINVYSETGRGTTFRIYLPRLARPSDTKAAWSPLAALRGGSETILLVEDEFPVRAVVQELLARLGYRVLEAATGTEALAVWKEHRAEIRLLLTDLMMPGGMTGKELAAQLLAQDPKLKVVYASGYSADIAGQDLLLEEGVNFLAKPFEAHRLAQTVRNRLDTI